MKVNKYILTVTIGSLLTLTSSGISAKTIYTDNGDTLSYCVNNSSDNYTNISDDIRINADDTVNVITSRYTEWTGKVTGKGTLNILSGGERTYMGTQKSKGSTYPDWGNFTGDVHIFPYKEVVGSCGFYGIILHSGTFQPDNISGSNYNKLFEKKRVVLHEGATIAIESGTRGIRFGELSTEKGSYLTGYYKKSSAISYYILGGKNSSSTLAGRIYNSASGNKVGIIKEGTGTYSVTGTNNDINAGIRLTKGTISVDNDIEQTKAEKGGGATGKNGSVIVYEDAVLAGTGSVASATEVYGSIKPGNDSIGTLYFTDFQSETSQVKVTLHPVSNIIFQISDTLNYDRLQIDGTMNYSNKTEDFDESDAMPKITLELTDTILSVNDEFVLLSATTKSGTEWNFNIIYPKCYTWVVEHREDNNGTYQLVAKVTSLDYNGQGDITEDDDNESGFQGYPDDDWSYDLTDNTPLRTYAEILGKNIGVAAASYRYDCSRNDGETGLVGNQFNMIVGENEMKFDATEPGRNSFNYGGSDAIVWVASRFNQEVRGHTLAWHSQLPEWVSQDGRKNNHNFTREELLSILKNHIFNVVGKYKGQITEWDVCNEVLDDDQSIVRTNPDAYKLRPSIWATYIGEDFIDSAFVWAHQADPQAKLYINDYGVEFMGGTKSEAYYNLVKRLINSGIPIEGCGLQCHLTTGELDTLKLEKNIQRYAAIGMKCIITELDIALANPSASNALDLQAKEYGAITRIFLRNDNCSTMLVWGISDNHSWRQNKPLLYDSNLKAKPAYYNIHAQLRIAADRVTSVNSSSIEESSIKEVIYYNLSGQIIDTPKGLVIRKTIFSNGKTLTEKALY
ncbi:MAG: endo-1,4-beta-xylanase [Bacteroidaceae bacterium]|nr:endo-1,4-beta-xylanase [Bacteroidaceae bacterium]